jgi:NSS family neurotransmitter:Na+ symporter
MLLEFGLGNRAAGAAPKAMRQINKNLTWFGWFAAGIGLIVLAYYAVILAWTLIYVKDSIHIAQWAQTSANASKHFFDEVLIRNATRNELGGFRPVLTAALVVTWILITTGVWRVIQKFSQAFYLTVFLPWLLLLIFIIHAACLPGANDGLRFYLSPDWRQLTQPQLWLAAYTQVFFSISLGFGVMIAYSSRLPHRMDSTQSALIVCFLDSLTSFLGGLAVFGALGWMAHQQGVSVETLLEPMRHFGLAFIAYPTLIAQLPFAPVIGTVFFTLLLLLGLDSAFSLVESFGMSLRDKWRLTTRQSSLCVALPGFLLGLPLVTGSGWYWLFTLDYFMTFFALSLVCLLQCLLVSVFYNTTRLRFRLNNGSTIRLGWWWDAAIAFVAPAILVFLLVTQLMDRIKAPPEGLTRTEEFWSGWLGLLLPAIIALILWLLPEKTDEAADDDADDVLAEINTGKNY